MSSNSMLGKGTAATASLDDAPRKKVSDPNARQVGGSHYSLSEYQHWDYATDLQMRHLEGAATKYLSRFGNKDGEPAEKDLEKVVHYLEKLLYMYQESRICSLHDCQGGTFESEPYVSRFIALGVNGYAFKPRTVAALILLSRWGNAEHLEEAIRLVIAQREHECGLPKVSAEPARKTFG